jgi:hypothetical protein
VFVREPAPRDAGIVIANEHGMALFWETSRMPLPVVKPAALSPLAIALLLKLQSESGK